MHKLNFVRDGLSKLPPGFRFQPTDEEIVFQYLARKIFSHPLPPINIPEINISYFDPWELPGNDLEQDRYFFLNKEANNYRNNGNNQIISSKATCSGYWKATGSANKRIISSKKITPIVGIRRSLVFYKRKRGRAFRTDWIMYEYFLAISDQEKNYSQGSLTRIGNWTLCRVFLKKRSTTIDDNNKPENSDNFVTEYTSDTDSSSASSSS